MKFIRIGGLSPVKQKGNYGKDGFHNAPARRGIYAFPFGVFEPFLLTGRHDKWEVIKEDVGNTVDAKYRNKKYYLRFKEDKIFPMKPKKPRRFYYNGPIWCHLDNYLSRKEKKYILRWYNEWILVEMELYEKLFKRAKRDLHNWSKDHMEVFIERLH